MTHTVILFRREKNKAFWTHYSSHCGCALIWNKVERRGGKGEERYSAKAQLQTSLLCWMKAELQLAGAFRVLFMGLQWRKAHGVAKAICATLCTITAFSPKMLFGMGDWGNNYTGESLKPEAVQCGRSAQHARVGKKKEHNLHKPANLSFDNSMAVCIPATVLLCAVCVQDLPFVKVRRDNLPSSSVISPSNLVCVLQRWGPNRRDVLTPNSEGEVLHLTKILRLFKNQRRLALRLR